MPACRTRTCFSPKPAPILSQEAAELECADKPQRIPEQQAAAPADPPSPNSNPAAPRRRRRGRRLAAALLRTGLTAVASLAVATAVQARREDRRPHLTHVQLPPWFPGAA